MLTNCRIISLSGMGPPPGHTGIYVHNNNIQPYFTWVLFYAIPITTVSHK